MCDRENCWQADDECTADYHDGKLIEMDAQDVQRDIMAGIINAAMEEWDALTPGECETHMASHIAAALSAAGLGPVPAARAGAIQEAAAVGWDAAVAAMKYEDGTPVDLAANVNPYRT